MGCKDCETKEGHKVASRTLAVPNQEQPLRLAGWGIAGGQATALQQLWANRRQEDSKHEERQAKEWYIIKVHFYKVNIYREADQDHRWPHVRHFERSYTASLESTDTRFPGSDAKAPAAMQSVPRTPHLSPWRIPVSMVSPPLPQQHPRGQH